VCATCFNSLHPGSPTPPPSAAPVNGLQQRATNGHVSNGLAANGHAANGLNGQATPLALEDLSNHQDCPAEMAESALTCFGPHAAQNHQQSNSCGFSYAAVVAAGSQAASLEGKQGGQPGRKTAAAYV